MTKVVTSQCSRIIASGNAHRAGMECREYRSEEDPRPIEPYKTPAERFYDRNPKLNEKLELLRQSCPPRR